MNFKTETSSRATASGAVTDYSSIKSTTQPYTLNDAAHLDDLAKLLQQFTREQLHDFLRENIEKRAAAKARSGVPALLVELTEDRGLSWVDLARLVKVSVSAVRKWRRGGDATAESRLNLARVAAVLDLLAEFAVADPAQWMEIPLPLPPGYTIRPIDLYEHGDLTGILAIAANRRDAEDVLDGSLPNWRDTCRSDFEVAKAPDGGLGLQRRFPR